MAARLSEGLHDAAGASGRFAAEVRVFNYPEHASTARELDEAVRYFNLEHSQVKARGERAVIGISVE